jgi:hypothetical protein
MNESFGPRARTAMGEPLDRWYRCISYAVDDMTFLT